MSLTYDSINERRVAAGKRRFTLSEYEQHRGRWARMAQPGTDVGTFLMAVALTQAAPDYVGDCTAACDPAPGG